MEDKIQTPTLRPATPEEVAEIHKKLEREAVVPLKRNLHFSQDDHIRVVKDAFGNERKQKVTKPLKKDIDALSKDEPLTPDNIRKMENNIFVNLREQFPRLTRRELRAETRRRLNEEIKRRKGLEKLGTATNKTGE